MTSSGRFLNYYSNHPKSQKFNTVIAMKNRITHISNERFLKTNLTKLFDLFANNGYPKKILKWLIYNSNVYDGPTDDSGPDSFIYKRLPYVSGLTDQVISLFKSFRHVKIIKYNILKNSNLFSKVKDRTPLMFQSNVIYELPCLNCQGCYIGQTSQWLRQRIYQHNSDCRVGKKSCALAQHFLSTGHKADYTNVKVLEQVPSYRNRLFLEMCHINNNSNAINYKSDTNQLNSIYCNILG